MRRVGPISQILDLLPRGLIEAFGGGKVSAEDMDPKEIDRVEAIVNSMTPMERRTPQILNTSRKRRIARGSGTSVADVNSLLKQFSQSQTMVRHMVTQPAVAGDARGAHARSRHPGSKKVRRKKKR
jgi:signal recognition particle subunit SRP54